MFAVVQVHSCVICFSPTSSRHIENTLFHIPNENQFKGGRFRLYLKIVAVVSDHHQISTVFSLGRKLHYRIKT